MKLKKKFYFIYFLFLKVPGLVESLDNQKSQVCSIYSPETVPKVYGAIKRTKNGNALFTYPNTPIKCAGAPQKIMYLAEAYWQKVKYIFQN